MTLQSKVKAPRISALELAFVTRLQQLGSDLPAYEREFVFHPQRKWRFDFGWTNRKIAVEVDGGQFAARGGRHNQDEDRWKMAEAAALGWRVLRFSGTMITNDPARCVELLRAALNAPQEAI